MQRSLPIRCHCGKLRGQARDLSPGHGNHLVCHCADCQAFAFATGSAARVLDAHGGTGIFQTSPARIVFEAGREHLACLRLTPKGPLRWYASCCDTPLGNTPPSAGLPFVGLLVSALEADAAEREATLGPVRYHVQAVDAKGEPPAGSHAAFPLSLFVRIVPPMLMARLRGDGKRSPFFEPGSGRPVVAPRTVSEAERARIDAAREAWLRD